jgi:hypothetical protein
MEIFASEAYPLSWYRKNSRVRDLINLPTLQKNSQEISVTSTALARPQLIRQENFLEVKTSPRK